jgi:hypothetical protein
MFHSVRRFAALVALISAPLAGCAHAYEGPGGYSEVLSELPADAPPGDCYARVKVPGEPVGPPPVAQGAQWVLNPGPPGSPGPIWCLTPTGPVPVAASVETIARYGWIRVLCDKDATPERIGRVQKHLYERGYYRGEMSGRYDAATAEALARFQAGAHIAHGGYLSLETLQALDAVQAGGGYTYQASSSYSSGAYTASGYAYQDQLSPCAQACAYAPPPPPVYAPPPAPCCAAPPPVVYYQPVYAPPPCGCAAPQAYGYGGGYSGGYGYATPTPAYAAASASASAQAYVGGGYASARASAQVSTVQNGWLMWSGKSRY